jgi:hypothetical protein
MEKENGMNDVMADPTDPNLETWKNVTKGRVVLQRLGAGNVRRAELVGPDRVVHLSAMERRVNQELAASTAQDVFSNGALQPVRLADTDEAKALAANPNHLKEDEAVALFSSHWKTFEKRVNEIGNPAAIERLVELSRDPKVDASVRQVELLKDRLAVVAPSPIEEREQIGTMPTGAGPTAGPKPVSTR